MHGMHVKAYKRRGRRLWKGEEEEIEKAVKEKKNCEMCVIIIHGSCAIKLRFFKIIVDNVDFRSH